MAFNVGDIVTRTNGMHEDMEMTVTHAHKSWCRTEWMWHGVRRDNEYAYGSLRLVRSAFTGPDRIEELFA